ncbi:hypothetical protein, partial [Bacillus thuringiensis]|uniref:hypothetical protein n=1 Tax=Bacillus thuringiensis TaxID=1428 RepID=UPI001A8E519F
MSDGIPLAVFLRNTYVQHMRYTCSDYHISTYVESGKISQFPFHLVFCKIKVQSIAAKFPACNFTWRKGHD